MKRFQVKLLTEQYERLEKERNSYMSSGRIRGGYDSDVEKVEAKMAELAKQIDSLEDTPDTIGSGI